MRRYDAVVVGSGPNGLAAAITLARAGRSVLVLEAEDAPGGGLRTEAATLPGFVHDTCSAIHPMAAASPFFRDLPLAAHGLGWIHPPAPLAHPFEDGTAVIVEQSLDETARRLDADASAYRNLMRPLVDRWRDLLDDLLAPPHLFRHPLLTGRFGLSAAWPAAAFARSRFRGRNARALFAGLAAHSILPLSAPFSASFGLVLGLTAHAVGWPLPRGGSQNIADALIAYLRSLGGDVQTGVRVRRMDDLPEARAALFDVTPRQLLSIAGGRLPDRFQRRLARFRYGPGVYKIDYALRCPVPWKAPECARAATLHLGGTLEEIERSEECLRGAEPARAPYLIFVQQSLFDASRAPAGQHTGWAYCHVPNGCEVDMTERMEMQIERFAPGFRDCVLARRVLPPAAMEAHNSNYVGGDIAGGAAGGWQLLTRPFPKWNPYTTPAKGLYLCSSSTPPGAGVHGMCGFYAALAALKRDF